MARPPVLHDWEADEWDAPDDLYEFEGERNRPSRGIAKVTGFLFLLLVAGGIVVGGFYGLWVLRQVNPPGKPGAVVAFKVTADDDITTVAARLESEGIITNSKVFLQYVKQKGGLDLQIGTYQIALHDNLGEVTRALRTSPAQTFAKVTFPEGFTLDQVSRRLSKEVPRFTPPQFMEVANSGKVRSPFQPDGVSSLEGLVFPDTYQIAGDQDDATVLKRMINQMVLVGNREGLDKAPEKVLRSPYEVLIVASLVEKEAKFDEDRAKIASVIYNRLGIDKELEIDAALFYGQPSGTPFKTLRNTDSAYNVYMHKGLPPTPIASPGAASIRAALNPAPDPPLSECPSATQCKYLYYVVSDKEGHHVFASTVEKHDENVAVARAAGLLG
jgi:UPF0755 protein